MQQAVTGYQKVENYVLEVSIVQKVSILGYNNKQKKPFLRITLLLPKHVTPCRNILKSSFNYGNGAQSYITYESSIHNILILYLLSCFDAAYIFNLCCVS